MHRSKQFTNRSEHGLSASADSINRTATIHRCSRPHSNTRGTDAWGHHGSRDQPRWRGTLRTGTPRVAARAQVARQRRKRIINQ